MKTTPTIKDAFTYAWNKLSENFWFLVLLTLAFIVLSGALGAGPRDELTIGKLVNAVVSFFMTFTFVRFGLSIGKGEKPFWNKICDFKPALFGRYILGSLAYSAMNLIGLALFVVPGVLSVVRFGFFGFILVDEGVGPVEALKRSWDMTKGRFWRLLGLAAALILINAVGALAAGIGLLITAPLSVLAVEFVYRRIRTSALPAVISEEPAKA